MTGRAFAISNAFGFGGHNAVLVPGGRDDASQLVHRARELLSPVERLEALCDRGSLTLLRSDVRSRRMGERARRR